MEAKKKSQPKASVVVARKRAPRVSTSRSPLKSARGIVALLFATAGIVALLSMVLWTHFPALWEPLVVPGKVLLNVFSWAAYFLPLWLFWAAGLVFVPKFCPRMTYLWVFRPYLYCGDGLCASVERPRSILRELSRDGKGGALLTVCGSGIFVCGEPCSGDRGLH